jgi:hypothetical protein
VPRHGVPVALRVRSQKAPVAHSRVGNQFQHSQPCIFPETSLHNNRSRFYPILALKLESARSQTSWPRRRSGSPRACGAVALKTRTQHS